MRKIDKTVIRETVYITVWVIIFSVILQAVCLVLGFWNYKLLLGNILGAFTAVLNFFFMGLSVQKAVLLDEKKAKETMNVSMVLRTFMMLVLLIIAAVVPVFNIWTAVIPMFFPRIAISIKPLVDKNAVK